MIIRPIKPDSSSRGFTLLEMLISLGIFMVVAVIAVGSLVRITGLNKQAQTMQSSMNSLSFVLESMSREMRMGYNLHCETNINAGFAYESGALNPKTCPMGTGSLIAFDSANTDSSGNTLVYAYEFDGTTLEKAEQSSPSSALTFYPILDVSKMSLTSARFGVLGWGNNYYWALIQLAGYAGVRTQDENFFTVQTSVSERLHD